VSPAPGLDDDLGILMTVTSIAGGGAPRIFFSSAYVEQDAYDPS